MFLIHDTETTGFVSFNLPASDPGQPRLVQLAAALYDEERRVVAQMCVIVQPEGFDIPAWATAKHGITTQRAQKYGVPVMEALGLFGALAAKAKVLVAHNLPFDETVVAGEVHRAARPDILTHLFTGERFCTMRAAVPVCQLPKTSERGEGEYKWPSLREAHRHLCGEDFQGAHDAMADTWACARVFFHLRALEAAKSVSL